MDGGTYTLLLALDEPVDRRVGALGERSFPAGAYAYTGSALGAGGFARVDRHRRLAEADDGTRHWHLDYLLPAVAVEAVFTAAGAAIECEVARSVPGDRVEGFGASDCDCDSHLAFESDGAALRRDLERRYADWPDRGARGRCPVRWRAFYARAGRNAGGMRTPPVDVRDRPPYTVDQFRVKAEYKPALESILVPEGEIVSRIEGMADEISGVYRDRAGTDVYALCVLKGAMRFFGALSPRLDLDRPFSEGVVRADRYDGGDGAAERAEVRWLEPERIAGKDILVVEDVIDEGFTLSSLLDELDEHDPNSVEVAVLFDKVARRRTEVDVAYTGFVIPDEFVVGYGLDYDERYRNLRHLGVLDEAVKRS